MQVCPNCSHRNRPGVVFCENCGASLIGDAPLGTKSFGGKLPEPTTTFGPGGLPGVPPSGSLAGGPVTPPSNLKDVIQSIGTDVFDPNTILRLEVEGAEPILLKPKQETIFGRRDPATGAMPDVDMTPYAGYRMGVSRRHAAIRRSDGSKLDLWDLGSSNGTFLNGTRLIAHRPNRLHDGDEIRLGQMVIRVFFQQQPAEGVSAPAASTAAPAPATAATTAAPTAPAGAAPGAPNPPASPASTASSAPPSPPAPTTVVPGAPGPAAPTVPGTGALGESGNPPGASASGAPTASPAPGTPPKTPNTDTTRK